MRIIFTLYLILIGVSANAQTDFLAVQNGVWNIGTTWGSGCTSGCVAGTDFPGANDNAFTERFSVRIPSGTYSVNNLYVAYDTPNGINKTLGTSTLVITGQLAAYDPDLFDFATPTTNVVNNTSSSWTIQFTGQGLVTASDPVITSWSSLAPLRSISFNPPSGSTVLYTDGLSIASSGALTVQNGTLYLNSGQAIQYTGTSASIAVNSGATLNVQGAVNGDGTPTSRFHTVNIEGTLITGSSGYVNSANLSLGASGRINVGFFGSNQTEGWWHQSMSPDNTFNMDNASTVSYNASQNQAFFATTYGNLRFSGTGTISKTVAGTGSVNIAGNLSFGNSGVTMNSTLPVVFNGTGAQNVSGGGTANFNGGLEINKSAETFTLSQNIAIQSGLTVTQGSLNASNYTITLNGNLSNNGSITFGTGATVGTLVINGTTFLSGSIPSFGNLTVNTSRSLSGAGTINVAGNLSNNGTVGVTGINFNGTSAQSISGSIQVDNIAVSNSSGVSNNGTLDVAGTVTLTGSGSFDADGSGAGVLTLKSTGLSTTARIAALPNPSLFSGDVTVERFINSPEDWRYLAIPITNGNVGMWQDNFDVTGNFTNPSSGPNVIDSSAPSIYYFDAATQTWTAVGSGSSTGATSLSNTSGYSVWSYLSANVSVNVTGQIGKGQRSVSIRNGDNLIPNPYPSEIDWDNVNLTGGSLSTNTIYVRTGSGTYASYLQGAGVGTGHPLGNGWGGEIALGQSFWVLGNGNGIINFQEDDKTSNGYFVRESTPSNYLRIKLLKDEISDDVIIYFNENATPGKDVEYDALKKVNDISLNLSTYNGDPLVDYAINGIPLIQCDYTTGIKLGNTNPEGTYAFSFEDLSSMKLGYNVTFKDKFLNVEKSVTEGTTYSFSITSDPASGGSDRFELTFTSPEIDLQRDLQLSSTVQCNNSMVKLEVANSQPGVQYLFRLNDTGLHEAVRGDGGKLTAWISKSSLAYGLNKLSLVASSLDGCRAHIFNEAVAVRFDPIYEIGNVVNGESCGEGSVSLTAEGAPSDGSYFWYDSLDAMQPIAGATGPVFNTPLLNESRTYFVSAVNASGCESVLKVPVEARISHVPVPVISVEGNLLTADQKSGLQWFKDGAAIEGATGNTLQVTESGLYTCRLTKGSCSSTSEGRQFIISSIEEVSSLYHAYPNPVEDYLELKGPFENSAVELFDNKGRSVMGPGNEKISFKNSGEMLVDMRSLKKGLYLINLTKGRQVHQIKVMKK